MDPIPLRILTGLLVLAHLAGCTTLRVKRKLVEPEQIQTLDRGAPYLKIHARNGDLYILSPWRIDDEARVVSGPGNRYDPNRVLYPGDGFYSVSMDSVALYETNTTSVSPSVAAMAIITGASIAFTIYCLSNTKACFGSCPTFYADDGTRLLLQAEGFSASVAPSLEASDIDALYRSHPRGGPFKVVMTNEALETHVVRRVELLAFPVADGERVAATPDGRFHTVRSPVAPETAIGPEGDFRDAVSAFDGRERWSSTDPSNLATEERLEFTFPASPAPGPRGLLMASRQSLLSTYLFYQSLAYMGTRAGEWLARMERRPEPAAQASGMARLLGGITIEVETATGWTRVDEVQEHGPLATDLVLIPLPAEALDPVRVRLRATAGKQRLDYLALAAIGEPRTPLRLHPASVRGPEGESAGALTALREPEEVLVTFPGDRYTLGYDLPGRPDGEHYEVLLESRGYYLEWMRREWMAEENPGALAEILLHPERALRRLAPEFKQVEADMDDVFWSSKYAHP